MGIHESIHILPREIIRRRNEAKGVVTLGALLRNKEKSKVVKDVLRVLSYSNT